MRSKVHYLAMIFLVLVLLPIVVEAVKRPDYSKFPRITPAQYRDGHQYYIEVDNIAEKFIFKPIAVLLVDIFSTVVE
ncbi:unnamed protein product [Strongylus vulgaris]|uniref:Uncharacterized protein n=1 Tax=Strongylus vulgaris TaxID=40348 RepID=A0A3P7K420_STRVU|nr:unnamed protein product [Strongylus vulgaris]